MRTQEHYNNVINSVSSKHVSLDWFIESCYARTRPMTSAFALRQEHRQFRDF
jgi:hypothetical protein